MINLIRCDIDGVVRNFVSSVYHVLDFHYPEKTPDEEPIHRNWSLHLQYPKFNKSNFYNLVFNKHAEQIFYFAKPYELADEFIKELNNIPNFNLIFRTHQNKKTGLHTHKWILEQGWDFDGLFMSNSKDNKEYIDSIIIDDKPDNIIGKPYGILMDRPWNHNFKYDRRAFNYEDVIKKIRKLIKNG